MARYIKSVKSLKGKSPGSMIFVGKKKMDSTQVRAFNYNSDMVEEYSFGNIDDAISLINDDSTTWINIDGIHEVEALNVLKEKLEISAVIFENILNTTQRPKIIEDEKCLTVVMKALKPATGTRNEFEQVSFILGKNYVISFQEVVGNHFDGVRERLKIKGGKIRQNGPDYLLFTLIDSLIDNLVIGIEQLGDKIEEFETTITANGRNISTVIFDFKKELTNFRKVIRPAKEIATRLLRPDSQFIKKKNLIYYYELDDLTTQAAEGIEIYYNLVMDQWNLYNSNISKGVNEVMKVLTIFSAIFIPLTFIVGVYGTNFDFLPELHFKYSYFVMWAVMIIISLVMLFYFKRKKWL